MQCAVTAYCQLAGQLPRCGFAAFAGRTTNYRRTIGTLEYVVSGLCQDQPADAAIPIVTAAEMDEILFGNTKACEQLAQLMSTQRRALKGVCLLAACTARHCMPRICKVVLLRCRLQHCFGSGAICSPKREHADAYHLDALLLQS